MNEETARVLKAWERSIIDMRNKVDAKKQEAKNAVLSAETLELELFNLESAYDKSKEAALDRAQEARDL